MGTLIAGFLSYWHLRMVFIGFTFGIVRLGGRGVPGCICLMLVWVRDTRFVDLGVE